jgi:hypothetical protein
VVIDRHVRIEYDGFSGGNQPELVVDILEGLAGERRLRDPVHLGSGHIDDHIATGDKHFRCADRVAASCRGA